MTSVSIAMATYNGAPYIAAQLASFVSQTRPPDELVVSDDGSTDGTVEIVRAFAQTAPFTVRIEVNAANLGYAQNFNRALTLCTGELVFLSDQDDVWLDDKIARMEALADANPERGCFMNDARLTDASLQPAGITKWGQIQAAGLPDSAFVMGCCAAFRRSLLELLLPVPAQSRSHDNWLVEVSGMLGLVLRTDEALQLYRRHGTNVSDFHVNRLRRVGLVERMAAKSRDLLRRVQSSTSLVTELAFLERVQTRLAQRPQLCTALAGEDRAQAVKADLDTRIGVLRKRLAIHTLPRLQRIPEIVQLWRHGAYLRAGGLPGPIKDALIRSHIYKGPAA